MLIYSNVHGFLSAFKEYQMTLNILYLSEMTSYQRYQWFERAMPQYSNRHS